HLEAAPAGDRLCQLGLSDAGGTLDQDRLCDLLGEIDRGRDLAAGDIALRGKPAFDGFDSGKGFSVDHGFQLQNDVLSRLITAADADGREFRASGVQQDRAIDGSIKIPARRWPRNAPTPTRAFKSSVALRS